MKQSTRVLITSLLIFPLIAYAKSLWDDNGEIFTDKKPLANGTIVGLLVQVDESILYTVNQNTGGNSLADPLGLFEALPQGSGDGAQNSSTAWQWQHNAVMSAQLTGYNAGSDTYSLEARRNIVVNNQRDVFVLSGRVAASELRSEATIALSSLANLTLQFQGRDLIQKDTLSQNDFVDGKILPTSNFTPELKDNVLERLFLKAINEVYQNYQ